MTAGYFLLNGRRIEKKDSGAGGTAPDCTCGAGVTHFHTVHENNPTGHAVGCPVYLRWKASQPW